MDDKKRAAAVAAVTAYLRKEEEGRIQPFDTAPEAAFSNLWGISGRQAQMQLRSMMQLKAFHGSRMR
ncbi:MAG: hypothetical protein C4530_15695 [Desulfobacteraceae bacterium]|nr:MAG: hypothetical protein C4530_15695 [Desulfobacteraceae bacterium]